MNTPNLRALLEKPGRGVRAAAAPMATANEYESEFEPFACGRIGSRPQLTLLFRKSDQSVLALAYSYFYSIESDYPDTGFLIDFSHVKVEVRGRNLERLFHLVCQHRAAEIVEASQGYVFEESETTPVVEEIVIRQI